MQILTARNLARVAEVWLDDYKKYFYRTDPDRFLNVDPGDLTQQFELKARLNCKPFQYYLDVIAPEMLERYPLEPQYYASGSLQLQSTQKCLALKDFRYSQTPVLTTCSSDLTQPLLGSDFTLTMEKSIRYNDTNDQCLDAALLNFFNCHHLGGNQEWKYNLETFQIFQRAFGKCLSGRGEIVKLEKCDEIDLNQKWKWGRVNESAFDMR